MFHVAVRVNENVSREIFESYSNTYRVETLRGGKGWLEKS